LILDGEPSRNAATDVCDGSEMYQMYLGTRLVASGGRFLSLDRVCVDKDLQIPGQSVDSYRAKPRLRPCPIVERPLPMCRLLETVARGLAFSAEPDRQKHILSVARQVHLFIYPYWMIEFRRVQSWRYALGVFLALRPRRTAREIELPGLARVWLRLLYAATGVAGLTFPIKLFDRLRPYLFAVAKRLKPAV
jgi:hypothetical protein